jgi:hypothetical protein
MQINQRQSNFSYGDFFGKKREKVSDFKVLVLDKKHGAAIIAIKRGFGKFKLFSFEFKFEFE